MTYFKSILQLGKHFGRTSLKTPKKKWTTFVISSSLIGVSGTHLVSQVHPTENDFFAYFGSGMRFMRSMQCGLIISLDYYFSMIGLDKKADNYRSLLSLIHQRAADRVLNMCLANGGAYIKLGQGLVVMNHLLPVEYTETLKQLQDKCLTRHEGEVQEIFLEDFGKKVEEMYETFDLEPIAAASLAQVYEATTFAGEKVAVKVQYKDLQQRFVSDVATVEFLLQIIGFMHPNYNFAWIIEQLKETFKQELDFVNEGKNAEKCAADLKHLDFAYVPKVYWDLSSKRVLVAEFIDGLKIGELKELKAQNFDLKDLDTKLFEVFGEQIFQTGFVHGDPHSANLLVRKRDGKTELVLIDHGLYQTVPEDDRIMLSHMYKAVIFNDKKNMQIYSEKLGVKDYLSFAEVLVQRPLRLNYNFNAKLSKEEQRFVNEMAKNKFDLIMAVLREMPYTLLLVLRNLNTIRAIAQEHGDPIDKYSVLARQATKAAFGIDSRVRYFAIMPHRVYLEARLMLNKINMWMTTVLLRIMFFFGWLPTVKN